MLKGERRPVLGSPPVCIERLQQYIQAGVLDFALHLIRPDGLPQFERVTNEVLATFHYTEGCVRPEPLDFFPDLEQEKGSRLYEFTR